MQDQTTRFQQKLEEIERAIAYEERLRGVRPAAEVDARLADLQQKAAQLRADLAVADNPTNSNLVVGNRNRKFLNATNILSSLTKEALDRRIILKRVKEFWVEGVLENSLHGQVLVELGMEKRPDTVDSGLRDMVLHMPERPSRLLPAGTKMVKLFDEMNRALLILGEPGSGKTTMLLELARDTIARAESDLTQPIPVVFNLSSWTNNKPKIVEWLVEELNTKYLIPKKSARQWLENDELLPLLDGLDEVALELREPCVKAINNFRQQHLMPLVVCSRIADYEALTTRLKLQGAVLLQPLALEQIDHYLVNAGDELFAIRETLQHDRTLAKLAQSPLMLSIMVLAYRGMSVEGLQSFEMGSARRKHLFDTYIKQMFKRSSIQYSSEQTIQWLAWLAQKMSEHSQTVFLIEQLQPSWLSTRSQRISYVVISRLIGGLSWALAVSFVVIKSFNHFLTSALFGVSIGVSASLTEITFLNDKLHQKISGCIMLVIQVLIFALSISSIFYYIYKINDDHSFYILIALSISSIFSYFPIVKLRARRRSLVNDIKTVETLGFSWYGARRGCFLGIILGFILPFICFVLGMILVVTGNGDDEEFNQFLRFIFIMWAFLASVIGLITVSFGGLKSRMVETKSLPNQGIKLSIRNMVFGGIIISLVIMLACNALFFIGAIQEGRTWSGFVEWVTEYLSVIGYLAWFTGVSAALWYGALDIIQHYVLRVMLFCYGYAPWNYARFLDHATKLVFLQKVGGGYIFIHRLLLEHFAAMYKNDK